MAAEICIQSFASGNSRFVVGDAADSGDSVVSSHSAFFELVTPASTSVATVSFAYGTQVINRGDALASNHAAVGAAPGYFTSAGTAPAQIARKERLGAHR
jgi:hypothetical protein